MILNFKHILKNNIFQHIIQPRRAQIYVGFQCHQKCGFCYYKNNCSDDMFSFDKIKQQIDFEYEYGIRDFEITGGEPSEYVKLRDVCQYIKNKNKKSKIAIITNGGLYKSNVWDLIDEIVLSYHMSQNSKSNIMFPLGCTYDKSYKTIQMAQANNVLIRTNTVLGTFNLDDLQNIVNDIFTFNPTIINFLPINLFEQSTQMFKFIDYDKLRQCIKSIINYIHTKSNALVFIRYMPFCDMIGYEKYIVGQLQHIYDWFDWNRELDGTQILDFIKDVPTALHKLGKYGSTSIDAALDIRKTFYIKTNNCMQCKYFLICDGIENKKQLLKYIKPIHGKIIKNPLEFLQDTYNLYQEIYA